MTDWEIWACAAKVRADHGDIDGAVFASKRASDLYEAGDYAGFGIWLRISICVAELAKLDREDGTLH